MTARITYNEEFVNPTQKEYKYKDSDAGANNDLSLYNYMFRLDEYSDYYEGIIKNENFDIKDFSDKYLKKALEGFKEQIEYNKERHNRLIKEARAISIRKKANNVNEKIQEKKELLEDAKFYKQKANMIKKGLKEIENELKKRS